MIHFFSDLKIFLSSKFKNSKKVK